MFLWLQSSSRYPRDDGPTGSSGDRIDPFRSFSIAGYGMFLLLAALTLFFAPLLVYLIILRNEAPTWPPPDSPPLPRDLAAIAFGKREAVTRLAGRDHGPCLVDVGPAL